MANAEASSHAVNGTSKHAEHSHSEARTLDDLALLPAAELAALYAGGKPPQLGVLAGLTRGRLLSVPALDNVPFVGAVLASAVRAIAALPFLPWRGKSFAPPAESHRTSGRNRVFTIEALPFDAHVEKSALDHEPTLVLKYDRPENPVPMRVLVDEVREVARGLYLGPAYVRGPNGPRVLLWWGCVKE